MEKEEGAFSAILFKNGTLRQKKILCSGVFNFTGDFFGLFSTS